MNLSMQTSFYSALDHFHGSGRMPVFYQVILRSYVPPEGGLVFRVWGQTEWRAER